MPIGSTKDRELSLLEMLADPIVQAVMKRDGVSKAELENMTGAVATKLANGRLGTCPTNQQSRAQSH